MTSSNLRIFNRSSCALAIAVFMAGLSANAGEATVVSVKGTAKYSTSSGDGGVVKVGQKLRDADAITTPAGAEIDLDLGENAGTLRVRGGSILVLSKLETVSDGTVDLLLTKGSIVGKSKKLSAKSKYDIKTANSVAGIRGAEFSVTANGTVTVASGMVVALFVYFNSPPAMAKVLAGQIIEPVPEGSAAVPRAATAVELMAAKSLSTPVPQAK